MLSLRLISRAVPKTSLCRPALRSLSATTQYSLRRPTWQAVQKPSYLSFSTSIGRREPAGESDQELSEKFNVERLLELESRDPSKLPPSIEDFLQSSPFEVIDKPGTHEVALTRTFGNETIKIEFSTTDMNQIDEDEYDDVLEDDDGALEDEVDYEPSGKRAAAATRGGKGDAAAEDSIASADRAEEGEASDAEAELPPSYPLNLVITITKPGNRAIEIRAQSQDGAIDIDNINFFPKAALLEAKTPEDAHEARSLYAGPPFGNLDPELQAMIEKYLEERGIDARLATFLPEYVDFKEQREYVQWLANMKSFIDE